MKLYFVTKNFPNGMTITNVNFTENSSNCHQNNELHRFRANFLNPPLLDIPFH